MSCRIIFITIFTFFLGKSYSQVNIQWEARLNGAGNFIDKAADFDLDNDGNTYVTGTSYGASNYDIVTVKYDSDGTELWRQSYGGSGIDESRALIIDSNNDVYVTGARFISGTDWDLVILKYDGISGALLWSVIHTGTTNYDSGEDVAVDSDDNVVVVGTIGVSGTNKDIITMKYSAAGAFIWSNTIGGSRTDEGKQILVDASDNIYIGGTHEYVVGATYFDFRVAKYNSAGTVLWSITEDSGFGKLDSPNAMVLDPAGFLIIAGQGFTDILNEEDYLTMKFDATSGALIWKRLYAGDAEAFDVVNGVAVDLASNVYVTGRSKSVASSEDYYTIAYDATGTELWADRFSSPGLNYDAAKDIKVSESGLFIYVTGFSFSPASNNDYTTLKYDLAGELVWQTVFNGPSNKSDQALKLQLDPTENIFVTGNSHGGLLTNLDYSTIKYCQLTTLASADTAICIGESVTLNATGGEDVTWEVLFGDVASMSCEICETMTATPDESTTYIVSSTSLSGCVDYDTVVVTVNELPIPSIYHDTPLEFCDNDSVVLYTDTYDSYSWSTGEETISTAVFESGTYTLTIIDDAGCEGTADEIVTVNDLPAIELGDDFSVCPEEITPLLATGGVSYLWDANPTLSSLVVANPNAGPIVATEYFVTGTDENGCKNRDSITVSIFDLPAVNAGPDQSICVGDSVMLAATGAVSYTWEDSPSLSSFDVPNPWASPIILTKYFVSGTDVNGCSNIDSVIVSTLSLPNIELGPDTTICAGTAVQFFATGGLSDEYVWNPDVTLSDLDIYNPVATPIVETEYVVFGTDINGCSNSDSIFVFLNDIPIVSAGLDQEICIGDSVMLSASGASSYSWMSDPSLSDLSISNPWASPLSTKTYTVVGEDVEGCVNMDEVTVVVHDLPLISAGEDVVICAGDSTQLEASGGIIFTWDFDPTLSNFLIGNPWASPIVDRTYYVEGVDEFGCANTDEVVVSVNPTPIAPVIYKDSVFVVSSYEDNNQWYLDEDELIGETNDTVNYVDIGLNGEYWVLYTNEFGCSVSSNRIDNIIEITDVGVQENPETIFVNIYPNPTSGDLTIELEQTIDQVYVIDLQGKVILIQNDLQIGKNIVNLDLLPRGTYFLQLVKENQVVVKKVVKS